MADYGYLPPTSPFAGLLDYVNGPAQSDQDKSMNGYKEMALFNMLSGAAGPLIAGGRNTYSRLPGDNGSPIGNALLGALQGAQQTANQYGATQQMQSENAYRNAMTDEQRMKLQIQAQGRINMMTDMGMPVSPHLVKLAGLQPNPPNANTDPSKGALVENAALANGTSVPTFDIPGGAPAAAPLGTTYEKVPLNEARMRLANGEDSAPAAPAAPLGTSPTFGSLTDTYRNFIAANGGDPRNIIANGGSIPGQPMPPALGTSPTVGLSPQGDMPRGMPQQSPPMQVASAMPAAAPVAPAPAAPFNYATTNISEMSDPFSLRKYADRVRTYGDPGYNKRADEADTKAKAIEDAYREKGIRQDPKTGQLLPTDPQKLLNVGEEARVTAQGQQFAKDYMTRDANGNVVAQPGANAALAGREAEIMRQKSRADVGNDPGNRGAIAGGEEKARFMAKPQNQTYTDAQGIPHTIDLRNQKPMPDWTPVAEGDKVPVIAGEIAATRGAAAAAAKLPETLNTQAGNALIKSSEVADAAANGIPTIHEARKLLDQGIISGTGANFRTSLNNGLVTMGFKQSEDPVANTQAYMGTIARNIGQIAREVGGTQLSDADTKFAAKAAGGDIEYSEQGLRRLLDIGERAARAKIEDHNKKAAPYLDRKDIDPSVRANLKVEAPPAYQPPPEAKLPETERIGMANTKDPTNARVPMFKTVDELEAWGHKYSYTLDDKQLGSYFDQRRRLMGAKKAQ